MQSIFAIADVLVKKKDSHVGIFVDGRVIHLSIRGTQWIPLEYLQMQFKEVSFYK